MNRVGDHRRPADKKYRLLSGIRGVRKFALPIGVSSYANPSRNVRLFVAYHSNPIANLNASLYWRSRTLDGVAAFWKLIGTFCSLLHRVQLISPMMAN